MFVGFPQQAVTFYLCVEFQNVENRQTRQYTGFRITGAELEACQLYSYDTARRRRQIYFRVKYMFL